MNHRLPGPFHDGGATWVHDLFTLIFVAVIVVGVILLIRMLAQRPHAGFGPVPHRGNWTALHELDMRYARGEVGREEYLQRRADLLDPTAHVQTSQAPPVPQTTPPTEARPKK
jgi:putative membrane protein